ncbi:hypothetical protein B0T18DRAFT_404217 [Schizothecium vesticola]|uniref:Uncharacterized protein n=1 Tax=Schizothecium vesticola TaxID=314040 RepID=A0AA40KAQ0_9PEZI|nr:hypothetical protein B0T18DRAFT_404217 [Schizothecium vesticola]
MDGSRLVRAGLVLSVRVRAAAVYRNPLGPAVGQGGGQSRWGYMFISFILLCFRLPIDRERGGNLGYTIWDCLDAKRSVVMWSRWRKVILEIDRPQSRRRGLPCSHHHSPPKGTGHAGDIQIP